MTIICAHCGVDTAETIRCEGCGQSPMLRERYVLQQVVGEGASGTTYRAFDDDASRVVAIKEMGIHGMETFKAHELFEREAEVLCRLEHRGIPEFFDYFEWGEGKSLRFYLVMEFVEGSTLLGDLEKRQYTADEVRDVVWKLGEIARYLHGLSPPVIHRDIKPSNVLRRPDGTLVLIDFGSVRDAIEPDDAGSTIAGTIGYMAPEQLRGEATPASDVYGIGATALHLLVRKDPSQLMGPTNRLEWEDYVSDHDQLSMVLQKMLTMDATQRLDDGEALLEAMANAQSAESEAPESSKEPTPARRRDPKPSPRRRASAGSPPHYEAEEDRILSRLSDEGTGAKVIAALGAVMLGAIICGGWLTASSPSTPGPGSSLQMQDYDFDDFVGERGLDDDELQEATGLNTDLDPDFGDDGSTWPEDDAPQQRLERQDVLEALDMYFDRFRECSDGSVDTGHLYARFEVDTDGHVDTLQLQDPDASAELESCVRNVFDQVEFPRTEEHPDPIVYPVPLD